MHPADLTHPSPALTAKLECLFGLNKGGRAIEPGFRPAYTKLLARLGNPHLNLPPIIHIAGTNGKGSIAAMLRAIFTAAGYKAHVYTSPHLLRFNERIVLGGAVIDDTALEALIDEALAANGDEPVTFFEITTAMAFAAFSRNPADILILETGLGGRADCTNIIAKPYVSIISKISYDHTQFLGDDLVAIGAEKAGIMKESVPCILGYQMHGPERESLMDMFVGVSGDKKCQISAAERDWRAEPSRTGMRFIRDGQSTEYPRPALEGDHQIENAGAAIAAIRILSPHFKITDQHIAQGLTSVHWPGRMQRLGHLLTHKPGWSLWYDGGHNDSAADAIAAQLKIWQTQTGHKTHLILGMKDDKDAGRFLKPLLPHLQSITLTALPDTGGQLDEATLKSHLEHAPVLYCGYHADLTDAMESIIRRDPAERGHILITGSLYLAAKIPGFAGV